MKKKHVLRNACIFVTLFVWIFIGCDPPYGQTFGGRGDDVAFSALQTPDGGYIAAGANGSLSPGGTWQVWIVKTDANLNQQWIKAFGVPPWW